MRKAVRDFERQIAREAKANPKAFYKYARSKMKTCSAMAYLECLDGTMTDTDVDKAEILNTFFTSVFTLESLENTPTFENRLHNTELTDFLITNEEVEKILKTLKTTTPPGPDGLHPRVLVELTDELVEPFQKMFTKSLAEGTLPQNWKEGNITSIFKKGLKHLPGNYRLDFAKAFDTIPHQRLLVKLTGYRIGGKVLQWIAAFLEGRRQRVLVNGSKSSWSPVTSGTPQGSVLGPMLFVCYINDMPEVVHSPINMFADDIKIFRQMTA